MRIFELAAIRSSPTDCITAQAFRWVQSEGHSCAINFIEGRAIGYLSVDYSGITVANSRANNIARYVLKNLSTTRWAKNGPNGAIDTNKNT